MFANFITETCTGTTGDITLTGVTTNHIAFSEAYSDTDPVAYVIEDADGVSKCGGVGVYNTANTITRNDSWTWNGTTYVTAPGGNLTLSAGTHTVRVAAAAEQLNTWNTFHGIAVTSTINHILNVANTAVVITFDNVVVDGGMTHGSSPFSEFTCVKAGLYNLTGNVAYEEAVANLEVRWEVKVGVASFIPVIGSERLYEINSSYNVSSGLVNLAVGDKVRMRVSTALGGQSYTQLISGSGISSVLKTATAEIIHVGA